MSKLKLATVSQVLDKGLFGKAINGTRASVQIPGRAAYNTPPLTIEMWTKPVRKESYLLSSDPAGNPYFYRLRLGTYGEFGVELPLTDVERFFAGDTVVDGKWHYLAVVFEKTKVRLFVDGRETGSTTIKIRSKAGDLPGALLAGTPMAPVTYLCSSFIEELRISNVVRDTRKVPDKPMSADRHTIGLWRFGDVRAGRVLPDRSRGKNDATLVTLPDASMDEIDDASYAAGPGALDLPVKKVKVQAGRAKHDAGPGVLKLDGKWEMAENGAMMERLDSARWKDSVPARVPGSVHTALEAAGIIPDPKVGLNDAFARAKSFQTWWFRSRFKRPAGISGEKLVFDGVAIRCTVWLNNVLLGSHEGMFGGPEFDVSGLLQDSNTLVVRIDPAPYSKAPNGLDNQGWQKTVVFNNVYGWHYSDIPALGIWRSVRLEGRAALSIKSMFIATRNAAAGLMDLRVDIEGPKDGWQGKLVGTIESDNFKGMTQKFVQSVKSSRESCAVKLRFAVKEPKLWWPNEMGSDRQRSGWHGIRTGPERCSV
jgi:hypothetical protein